MTPAEKYELMTQIKNKIAISKMRKTDITQEIIYSQHIPGGKANGRWFKDSTTGQPTLRGFDVNINDNGVTKALRFLEQNPNKRDSNGNLKPHALLARQGHLIIWIIDRAKSSGGFIGRIHDGVYIPSIIRVAQNIAATVPAIQSREIPSYVEKTLKAPQQQSLFSTPEQELDMLEQMGTELYEQGISQPSIFPDDDNEM